MKTLDGLKDILIILEAEEEDVDVVVIDVDAVIQIIIEDGFGTNNI
jgi:hypothetical protein